MVYEARICDSDPNYAIFDTLSRSYRVEVENLTLAHNQNEVFQRIYKIYPKINWKLRSENLEEEISAFLEDKNAEEYHIREFYKDIQQTPDIKDDKDDDVFYKNCGNGNRFHVFLNSPGKLKPFCLSFGFTRFLDINPRNFLYLITGGDFIDGDNLKSTADILKELETQKKNDNKLNIEDNIN